MNFAFEYREIDDADPSDPWSIGLPEMIVEAPKGQLVKEEEAEEKELDEEAQIDDAEALRSGDPVAL